MKGRNILFALGIVIAFFACNSQGGSSAVALGYGTLKLNDNHKTISREIPRLQRAPEHVSAKRGEGFKEYYSTSEPVFQLGGVKFNPSVFCVFNPSDELVSFKVFWLCEVPKERFDQEQVIALLDRKIKGFAALSEKEGMKEQIGNDISKEISIDMESMDYPVIEYRVKYLP